MSETLTATALDSPGASLLVIDDSPTVLRVMEGVLNHAGYRVTCLESGTNVLETAREIRPELIFVDFAMPDISGYEVCRRLGQHPELQNIPVVIMSTRGDAVLTAAESRWIPVSVQIGPEAAQSLGPGPHPILFHIAREASATEREVSVDEKSTFIVPR